MDPRYLIALDCVEPTRLSPDGSGTLADNRVWTADEPAASDAMAARNEVIAADLIRRMPGLVAYSDRTNLVHDTMEDGVPPEAMIRRFHRARLLGGPALSGHTEITLMDNLARLVIAISGGEKNAPALVGAVIRHVHEASQYVPVLPWTQHATTPDDAAAALLARHEIRLKRFQRQARKEAILRRLGPVSAMLMTVIALIATAWIVVDSVRRGQLHAAADPGRKMIFITQTLPEPVTFLGLFPDYRLDGIIAETGEPVRLKVYRDDVVRARAGVRLPVLPTSQADTPYILRSQYDGIAPVLTLGPVAVALQVVLAAVPAGLWGWFVAWPWHRTQADQRPRLYAAMTRTLLIGLQVVVAIAVIAAVKLYL